MHDSGMSLHELKSGMQKYPQILINIKTVEKVDLDFNGPIQKAVQAIEEKLGDKGRVLLRASGTEPLIRVMVEGEDADLVGKLAQQLSEDVKQVIGA